MRRDEHDLLRDHEEMEAAWNYDADADGEVDVRDPKPGDESATQDDVVNPRPLQRLRSWCARMPAPAPQKRHSTPHAWPMRSPCTEWTKASRIISARSSASAAA